MKDDMEKAVKYFENMGIPIKNCLIDSENLTEEQLEILKEWESKTEIDGIMMPQIEDFYRSVLVAISLNPQKNEHGEIKYLFGKGIGIEIALRGHVQGRKEYETKPMYRSHSDFELYDAKEDVYTRYFQEIFGGQEYYPPTKTKGLRDIPEGEMDDTHEIVNLDGYEILIPKLEMLFLDKFLRKESTPRETGYDCELLAEKYELDKNLVNEYLEKYYFKYMIDQERKTEEITKIGLVKQIIKNLNFEVENGATNIEEAIKALNERVTKMKKIDERTSLNGIRLNMYTPINQQDISIDGQGKIVLTQEYIDKAMDLISNITNSVIENQQNDTLEGLNNLFEKSDKSKMKLDKENNDAYKFSEEEIGKATINTPTINKDNAGKRQKRDEHQIMQEEQKNFNEIE